MASEMRQLTAEGLALIQQFEGFSPVPYICAGGYETIGYGHVIRAGEWFPSAGINEAAAMALLREDVQQAASAVLRLIHIPLTDGQFDALVSFTFNLGSGALQRSSLRRKVNAQAHEHVPREFRRWVWAGGRKLRGLIRRREAEVQRYFAD